MADNPLFSDQENQTQADQLTVESLVGEGKRYKDVDALVKAVVEKDLFIDKIKGENAELRGLVKGEAALEAFLTKIKPTGTPAEVTNSGTPPSQSEANQMNQETNNQKPSLSLDEVQKLLDEREQKNRENANLAYAAEQARLAFGANAPAVLRAKAAELGMTEDELTAVARTKPQAFLKLVEAKPQAASGAMPRTQVNTASQVNTSNVRNNTFYEKLRKEIGNDAFFKPKIQNEMFRDAKELGDAFYA